LHTFSRETESGFNRFGKGVKLFYFVKLFCFVGFIRFGKGVNYFVLLNFSRETESGFNRFRKKW
jgi:hypothetical protein